MLNLKESGFGAFGLASFQERDHCIRHDFLA